MKTIQVTDWVRGEGIPIILNVDAIEQIQLKPFDGLYQIVLFRTFIKVKENDLKRILALINSRP